MSSWTDGEKCTIPKEILQQEKDRQCAAEIKGNPNKAADCIKPPEPKNYDLLLVVDRLRRLAWDMGALPSSVLFTAADLLSHDHMLQMKLDEMRRQRDHFYRQLESIKPPPSISELAAEIVQLNGKLHEAKEYARRLEDGSGIRELEAARAEIVRLNQFVQGEQARVARQRGTIEHLEQQVVELQKRLVELHKRLATIKECACG